MSIIDHAKAALPTLPQDEAEPASRAAKLELQQDVYRYVWDWPAGVATSSWLPEADDYSKGYIAKSIPIYLKIGLNYAGMAGNLVEEFRALTGSFESRMSKEPGLFKHHFLSNFREDARSATSTARPEHWTDYADVFHTFETPDVVDVVNDAATLGDAVAWQRVGGCNPMVLARCTAIPDHFPVTDVHYQAAMGAGDSLEAARLEGRLYLADYAVLDGVTCGVTDGLQKYLAAPLALYAVDQATGALRSVCIQCGQSPDAYPIFGPGDGWRWRMANQAVQVADANHHEGVAHLGRTHLVMEAVTLAMKRHLASRHPLHLLLEPHTETTLAINASAKTSLIAPGGTVDVTFAAKIRVFGDLVRTALASYSLPSANPRVDLSARGLLDRDALPQHPYRDDVLPVWDAIEAWVGDYVRLYYADASVVEADTELAAFAREIGAAEGGRLVDVVVPKTIDELVELITTFVFLASAQHSAVNFPQYPYMGYVPNMAGALYTPPPTADTPDTEEAFAEMLPPMKIAVESVTMVYLLSNVRDSKLGGYAPGHFKDPRVSAALALFRQRLRVVEADIQARDGQRFLPYPFLRPSQILQSISI